MKNTYSRTDESRLNRDLPITISEVVIPRLPKIIYYIGIGTCFLVTGILLGCTPKVSTITKDQVSTLILVRHAEKETTGKNPSLTTAGKSRAQELSKLLEMEEIDVIFSSNYNRTLETAQPIATAKNMEITLYDPSDLQTFAATLQKDFSSSTKLIVGHSNTTPDLINILMKEQRLTHLSEKDYDDLFILTLLKNGQTKLLPLKYGVPKN